MSRSEVELWHSGEYPLRFKASREMQHINEQAALLATAGVRREEVAEQIAKQRVKSNHNIARTAITESAITDAHATALSQSNPGLEMIVRKIQAAAAMGDITTIAEFQDRPI